MALSATEAEVSVGSEVRTVWNRQDSRATIVSESRTHWTIQWFRKALKIPKQRRPDRECEGYRELYQSIGGAVDVYLTEQGVVDRGYIEGHRHTLAQAVQGCHDAAVLRQIAALLGVTS